MVDEATDTQTEVRALKRRERLEEQYQENRNRLPAWNDYIFSQTDRRYSDLFFGKKGNIGDNGCSAVAVHNVMKFIGRPQDFCDVLHDMETLRMTWLGGRFGTKPWAIGKYFYKHKIPFWKYKSPNDFKAALLTHSVGIVCTWNERFRGMHFYCIYYSPQEKTYYTANLHSNADGFQPTPLTEISNLRFVAGYIADPPES